MGDNDDEFKAGRADIMKEVNSEKPVGYDIYADHVNSAYMSEQRFGFYTSFDDFAHINMIYKGQSSTVYIAKCKYSRGKVVLKAYELSNMNGGAQKILKTRLGIMQEIMAPARYQSSCNDIVRCFGFFEDRAEIVFVLEYCARADIMSYLRTQDMSEANLVIEIVQPVLRCLEHLHSNGFTHGNICPENILLTADGFLKVTDLDSLTWKSGMGYAPTARLQEPSLEYMSPEVVMAYFPQLAKQSGQEMSPKEAFTPGCDIWSLGAMVYELCTGQLPFNAGECDGNAEQEHAMQTALKIIHEDVSTNFLSTISPEAMSFVQFAMTRDLNTRPSVEDLMLHPWIQKFASVEVATMFDEPAESFDEFAARGDFGIRSKSNAFTKFREGLKGFGAAIKSKAVKMVGSKQVASEEEGDSAV